MKKDSNIIIRINSDLKKDVLQLMEDNDVTLSSVLTVYLSEMVRHGKIQEFTKIKAKAYERKKDNLDFFKIRNIVNETLNEYGKNNVKKVFLFGSFARNEQKSNSDIDLRFECDDSYSMNDTGNIRHLLKEKLNRNVDIVTEEINKLDPWFAEELRKEEICIYRGISKNTPTSKLA